MLLFFRGEKKILSCILKSGSRNASWVAFLLALCWMSVNRGSFLWMHNNLKRVMIRLYHKIFFDYFTNAASQSLCLFFKHWHSAILFFVNCIKLCLSFLLRWSHFQSFLNVSWDLLLAVNISIVLLQAVSSFIIDAIFVLNFTSYWQFFCRSFWCFYKHSDYNTIF